MKLLSPGVVAALLTVVAMVAAAAGKPQLAAFLGSPGAAEALATAIAAGGTFVSGVLAGVKPAAA